MREKQRLECATASLAASAAAGAAPHVSSWGIAGLLGCAMSMNEETTFLLGVPVTKYRHVLETFFGVPFVWSLLSTPVRRLQEEG